MRRITAILCVTGGLLCACATNAAANSAGSANAQPAMDQQAQDAQVAQASAELREHHRHHNSGGLTQFVAMSLDTLGGDDDKRPQIEKLQHDLNACLAPARVIEKNLLSTLADGVSAGSIDTGKVDATIGQLDGAAQAAHGCSVDALNQLHGILNPTERQALVDKVQAHWAVWRQVNHDAEAGGREKGGRLADLTQELALTPDQQDRMSAALHTSMADLHAKYDPQRAEAHLQAFSAAFVSDQFDAKAITQNSNGNVATHGSRRMAVFYETVAPLLNPDQRTKLAEHLREHASHHPAVAGN